MSTPRFGSHAAYLADQTRHRTAVAATIADPANRCPAYPLCSDPTPGRYYHRSWIGNDGVRCCMWQALYAHDVPAVMFHRAEAIA